MKFPGIADEGRISGILMNFSAVTYKKAGEGYRKGKTEAFCLISQLNLTVYQHHGFDIGILERMEHPPTLEDGTPTLLLSVVCIDPA